MSNSFLSSQEEAPLKTCSSCKDQPCIKTRKVCEDVEKLLKRIEVGRKNWLTYISNDVLENFNTKDKVKITGKCVKKYHKGRIESLYVSKGKKKERSIIE
jgi:hypothetical protein